MLRGDGYDEFNSQIQIAIEMNIFIDKTINSF